MSLFFSLIGVSGGIGNLNRSTLDDVGPFGGDQGMAVLKDMNELEAGHYASLKSLAPGGDI